MTWAGVLENQAERLATCKTTVYSTSALSDKVKFTHWMAPSKSKERMMKCLPGKDCTAQCVCVRACATLKRALIQSLSSGAKQYL